MKNTRIYIQSESNGENPTNIVLPRKFERTRVRDGLLLKPNKPTRAIDLGLHKSWRTQRGCCHSLSKKKKNSLSLFNYGGWCINGSVVREPFICFPSLSASNQSFSCFAYLQRLASILLTHGMFTHGICRERRWITLCIPVL